MKKATLIILGLLVLGGWVAGSTTGRAAVPAAQPAPGTSAGDWPTYGGDPSRTSTNLDETAINAGNVGQLVRRWQVAVRQGPADAFSAPSIANGRVYIGSSVEEGDNFFAFDALTGKK